MDLRRAAGAIRQAAKRVLPRSCRLCGEPAQPSLALCTVCRTELLPNRAPCQRCALPLSERTPPAHPRLCPHCLAAPPRLQRVLAPFIYEEGIAFLISRWKYHGEQDLAATFAALWREALYEPPAADLLLPVPLHWRRLLRRGFNQSADLTEVLAGALDLPWAARGHLRRLRPTAAQAQASRAERRANLRGVFAADARVRGLRVALVDDVCTTGATGESAAAALLDAGARSVQLWCIARTPPWTLARSG